MGKIQKKVVKENLSNIKIENKLTILREDSPVLTANDLTNTLNCHQSNVDLYYEAMGRGIHARALGIEY